MNEENAYNLIDEPWIPVLMQDGTNRSVSLGEVFADAEGQIADLALNPYERVAVFRLLLCIAQAALGPERLKDERAWRTAKDAVGTVSSEYLKKWHDRFFLYGPHAFLQPDDVKSVDKKSSKPCDNLLFELASGDNSTLFDHSAGTGRLIESGVLALGLLSYQNFSAGGTSSKCIWDGEITSQYISGAPCREQSMLFSILMGEYLLETVWLNILSADMISNSLCAVWGVPVWELDSATREATSCLALSAAGHLVPLSRAIKLTKESRKCDIGEGVKYPQLPEWREQMATVFINDKGEMKYIEADSSKMPWRDLVSILTIHSRSGARSALSLRHLESLPEEKLFSLWAGGLCWEKGKAKQIDTVEWSTALPVSMLEEPSLQCYESAIGWADQQLGALRFAAKTYSDLLKIEKPSRFYEPAERIYWDILAQPANQRLVQNVKSDTYLDDWKKACRKAAKEAYRRACPAVTARQMEAYAQGFAKLWVPDGKKDKAVGGTDSEEDEGGDNV